MNIYSSLRGIVVLLLLFVARIASAQEESKENTLAQAAEKATNPLAFVTKIQMQPNYTFLDNGGDQLSFIMRIMQPSKTIGLPFIKSKDPKKIYTIYRLEAPVLSQTVPGNDIDATGLSDFLLFDIIAFSQKWGTLGIGPALSIPTASSDFLGSGKWSAGLAGNMFYKKIPKLTLGVLAQQFISFAGDDMRNDVNQMLFQPVVTKVFNKGVFVNFSPIMVFDWENGNYNIPLGANIGKAFASNLSVLVGPEYVVSGPSKGNFTLRLNINTMF